MTFPICLADAIGVPFFSVRLYAITATRIGLFKGYYCEKRTAKGILSRQRASSYLKSWFF
jgi:hypothetical protein